MSQDHDDVRFVRDFAAFWARRRVEKMWEARNDFPTSTIQGALVPGLLAERQRSGMGMRLMQRRSRHKADS